jgi:hypothetical protein
MNFWEIKMPDTSVVYAVRLPKKIKDGLPQVAERYNFLNSQELVRAVLGMIVTGQIELTLVQNVNAATASKPTSPKPTTYI